MGYLPDEQARTVRNAGILHITFPNARVPFVPIGVSGTIYVGPNEDLALLRELGANRHTVQYVGDLRIRQTPDGQKFVTSSFYDLNGSAIKEAAAEARQIFSAYNRQATEKVAAEARQIFSAYNRQATEKAQVAEDNEVIAKQSRAKEMFGGASAPPLMQDF